MKYIKSFLVRVGIFFSLPLVALGSLVFFTIGYKQNYKGFKIKGYWTDLNDLMNTIYDEWAECLVEKR